MTLNSHSMSDHPLPPSTTVQVTFGAETNRGRSRAVNDDHYVVMRLGRSQQILMTSLPDEIPSRFDEHGYALIVADGVGSGTAGEAASRLAISTLIDLTRQFGKWNLRIDEAVAREIMARAERFYRHVDGAIMAQRREGAVPTDQTTLTAVFGAGHDLFFAHVGHSRAYLFRSGQLMRLTRDHTLGQQRSLLARAPLVDVTSSTRDVDHVLTDTMGMLGTLGPTIDIERLRLWDNDRVLVCTNGITDAINERRIGEILASGRPPSDQCRALVDVAVHSGAEDDATAVAAHYRIPH